MDVNFYIDKIIEQWKEMDDLGCPFHLQMALISVTDVADHEGYDGIKFCQAFPVLNTLADQLAERLPGHDILLTKNQIIRIYNKDIE